MSLTPLNAASFADLDDAPSGEIGPLVERAAAGADATTLKSATGLLLDRALRLLREGSRQELLEEALAVSHGLSGEAGRALRERDLETFGAWSALDDLLGEAARRSDRAAVPSLLRSTQGHGKAILELLAAEGRALPRAEVRRHLDLGEAHLSHLLRDLEEAELIVRYRPKGSKEVFVELGPAGREVVAQSVLPPWLERLTGKISEIAQGSLVEAEALARELEEAGAPSRLAAERLSAALAALAPIAAEPAPEKTNVLPFVRKLANQREEGEHRFQEILDLQGDQPARTLFTYEVAQASGAGA